MFLFLFLYFCCLLQLIDAKKNFLLYFLFLKLLAASVLVTIWSFQVDGHLYIACNNKNNLHVHHSNDNKSNNNDYTHGYINFTIRPPFREQIILEPYDCNESYWFNNDEIVVTNSTDQPINKYLHERSIYPSERLSCTLISAISVMSIIYCICYLYGYAYLRSSVDLFSQREVMSELLTSFLLTCCWFVCTISWTASVANLKHFIIFLLPYTTICQDKNATCSLSGSIASNNALFALYYSISFGYASGILWFICSLWRIYCNSRQVVFPSSLSSSSAFTCSSSTSPFSSSSSTCCNNGVSCTTSSTAGSSFCALSPAALITRTLFAFHSCDQRDHVTSAKFTRIHEPATSSPFHPSYQVILSSCQPPQSPLLTQSDNTSSQEREKLFQQQHQQDEDDEKMLMIKD